MKATLLQRLSIGEKIYSNQFSTRWSIVTTNLKSNFALISMHFTKTRKYSLSHNPSKTQALFTLH